MNKEDSDEEWGAPKDQKRQTALYTAPIVQMIDTTELIRILEVVSSCSKFSTTYCYLGGIF